MTLSTFLACYVLISSVAVIAAVVLGVGVAIARAGWAAPERRTAVSTTALVLVGWFALAASPRWHGARRRAICALAPPSCARSTLPRPQDRSRSL